MLDVGFVGLIFSCFNTEAQKVRAHIPRENLPPPQLLLFLSSGPSVHSTQKRGRVQIIAFQSLDLAKQEREREKDANNKSPRPPQLDVQHSPNTATSPCNNNATYSWVVAHVDVARVTATVTSIATTTEMDPWRGCTQ
jgi:hypothetical protein